MGIESSLISTLSLSGTLFLSSCGPIFITRDNIYILNILALYLFHIGTVYSIEEKNKQTNSDQEHVGTYYDHSLFPGSDRISHEKLISAGFMTGYEKSCKDFDWLIMYWSKNSACSEFALA